jgi:hypothetical protein
MLKKLVIKLLKGRNVQISDEMVTSLKNCITFSTTGRKHDSNHSKKKTVRVLPKTFYRRLLIGLLHY